MPQFDQHILSDIALGNEAAFRKLFDAYHEQLYQFMIKLTKSGGIAEEIVLDVFLKLWMGRELLSEIKDIEGFLYKVAYNKAIDFLRTAARNTRIQKMVAAQVELAAIEEQADHRILDKECKTILKEALEQLSPRRRLIFNLSRVEGLTHDQIADRLNLSRNTVRNTIAETLKSIRLHLKQRDVNILIILYMLTPG